MRTLLITLVILTGCLCVSAQENKTGFDIPVRNPSGNYKIEIDETLPAGSFSEVNKLVFDEENAKNADSFGIEFDRKKLPFAPFKAENERFFKKVNTDEAKIETDETDVKINSAQEDSSQVKAKDKFHWKPALIESGIFLGIQHGYRIARQKRTRDALGGPFFRDWAQSVKNLRGWRDGDRLTINYIGHPLQGGLTGRIFVNNSDRAKKQEFGKSKAYWESRFKAMAWSAAWSAQFELGPISEATIGNVGLPRRDGYSTMAYVDLVVTPTFGTGVLIGEDAIDKYVLKNWLERKSDNKMKIKLLRSVLTPTTSIANLLRGKMPWKRDYRPL